MNRILSLVKKLEAENVDIVLHANSPSDGKERLTLSRLHVKAERAETMARLLGDSILEHGSLFRHVWLYLGFRINQNLAVNRLFSAAKETLAPGKTVNVKIRRKK